MVVQVGPLQLDGEDPTHKQCVIISRDILYKNHCYYYWLPGIVHVVLFWTGIPLFLSAFYFYWPYSYCHRCLATYRSKLNLLKLDIKFNKLIN